MVALLLFTHSCGDVTLLTFVSLMQDVHTDQVQKSKCNTSTLGAPLKASLETEPGLETVLCVSTAKQLVPLSGFVGSRIRNDQKPNKSK